MSTTIEAVAARFAGGDEQLKAELEKYGRELETEHELDRVLGERLSGLDIDAKARKDLRARKIFSPTQAELLAAYRRAGAR